MTEETENRPSQNSRSVPMPDVMKKQREARRKIIRQWTRLPKDRRQSMAEISEFARTAAQQNENAFVRSRRDPYVRSWNGYCRLLIRSERPCPLHINCPGDV